MIKKTEICEMLGIDYPIIQAPMGPLLTTNLAAAVTNAGGFGTISHSGTISILKEKEPEVLEMYKEFLGLGDIEKMSEMIGPIDESPIGELKKVVEMTDGPIGVNVRVAEEQVDSKYLIDAIIEEKENHPQLKDQLVAVITSAGDPKQYTDRLHDAGLKVIHVVPSVYHAEKAKEAGVDAVVASGHEAGGHIAWEPVHTSVLLPAVVDAVGDELPVLSAGGWCDGRGLAAIFAMGGQAIYMGTRFICTQESDFSQEYKEALLDSEERETIVAPCVLGTARYMKNKYSQNLKKIMDRTEEKPGEINPEALEYEKENLNFKKSYIDGETEKNVVFSGEVQGRLKDIPKVEDLIQNILEQAEKIIKEMPEKHLE